MGFCPRAEGGADPAEGEEEES
uniref:Uncharacterized protein n=1 Tax=Arundo donax TaxID=35708 RepID=A0A0A9CRY5_ARUDO